MPSEGQRAAGRRDEQQQDEDERDEAAEVAERPAGAGDAADLAARREARQHGVGEDGAELRAEVGEHVGREHRRRVGHPGRGDPEAEAAERRRAASRRAPSACAPRCGRRSRRAPGRAPRPSTPPIAVAVPQSAWPRDRVADHGRREVGGEDEGDDQRLERLVRPVEQHPGEDAAAGGGRPAVRVSGGQGRGGLGVAPGRDPGGQRGLGAAGAERGDHPVGRHDAVGAGDGAADQHRGDRLAAAEHRLVDVEEARRRGRRRPSGSRRARRRGPGGGSGPRRRRRRGPSRSGAARRRGRCGPPAAPGRGRRASGSGRC